MHFAILMYDEPNSAALRDERRTAHLDYLKAFDDQTLFAGPFTTDDESADLGSLRLIDLADRAAAEKHVADEPYVIGGIQKRWKVHRWRGSVPYTWRDCPRKEGNIQALFYGLDHPGGMAKRTENRDAHEAYLNEHGDKVMVPDLDAGRELLEGDPFHKAGVYKDVEYHRWRFGRTSDRFKT